MSLALSSCDSRNHSLCSSYNRSWRSSNSHSCNPDIRNSRSCYWCSCSWYKRSLLGCSRMILRSSMFWCSCQREGQGALILQIRSVYFGRLAAKDDPGHLFNSVKSFFFSLVPSAKSYSFAAPNSEIAQLVEQATVNRWVLGSSPSFGA